ncbi:hypothetical protein T492DRAFT_1148063 [Pavlovales sp. CCMP2436]|nr:hypothetical protein T492DRAFT_1148063 [Pavlovales sp. CCMP2436]
MGNAQGKEIALSLSKEGLVMNLAEDIPEDDDEEPYAGTPVKANDSASNGKTIGDLGNAVKADYLDKTRIKRRGNGNRFRAGPGSDSWVKAGPVAAHPSCSFVASHQILLCQNARYLPRSRTLLPSKSALRALLLTCHVQSGDGARWTCLSDLSAHWARARSGWSGWARTSR